jgi:DNA-binding NarL/FixJ family response regulator
VRAGANGYPLAGAGEDALLGAIRAVGRGEATFAARVADRLLAALAGEGGLAPFPQLRPREREVLALLGAGHSTGGIARELELSPKTVRNQVASICTKLRVTDRFQAALRAREAGLTPALTSARRAPRSGTAR